nr:S-layer homology domain-containing protein [Lysinibacillus timonensis]
MFKKKKFSNFTSLITVATMITALFVFAPFQNHTNAETNAKLNPFTDVKPGYSHYNTILSLYQDGIVTGVTATEFKPNSKATRGETAQFIVNALGLDTTNVNNPKFPDVPTNHENYEAIAILYGKGVIGGYTNGNFGPNDSITRTQIATMITRAFNLEEATSTTTKFVDVNKLKDSNAKRYIQTLVNYNITAGTSPTTFSPNMKLTRGQLATFLSAAMDVENVDFEVIGVE